MTDSMMSTQKLDLVVCWCGIQHAIPHALNYTAEKDGREVYCPLGHQWVNKDPESERMKREIKSLRDTQERLIRQRDDEVKRHRATKGQLTKTKKRLSGGVCPCCNRSFVNVARHMSTQHPDYAHEEAQ